ncbi:hypothetical protein ABVK25_000409 [Lepraria finkii]|uniref:Uncharacterized protein n=1 Tax=Lepraria finkii TaxID=1340010 RepID=A0ABR4BP45_9LECA
MFSGLSPITASKIQIPLVIFKGLQTVARGLLTLVFRLWIGDGEQEQQKDAERDGEERES